MSGKLLLAPAAGGKTQSATDRITTLLADEPLSSIWAVVPDRIQGASLQKRLASYGTLGVQVGTFGDLYAEILSEAGEPFPITPEPVIHLLLRTSIDGIAERGLLSHYEPIRHKPGLVSVLADLFAELKRSLIKPQDFSSKVGNRGARLEELASLYEEYQSQLVRLNWSDHEGLGWLALSVLEGNPGLASHWRLLVVDGFDSFNPCQIALLRVLEPRVGEMLLTVTGDLSMSRLAFRRFARTLGELQRNLSIDCHVLPARQNPIPALAHLEAGLFQAGVGRRQAGNDIIFVEAQDMALEAREALRWIKARIVRDGVAPDECAVIAGDIGPYRIVLREAAREFGLPLHLACGEPLTSNPAVAAVLGLLELPLQDWARRPLLDVLRTPYFDLSAYGFNKGDALLLDEIARAGQVIGGIDQWREALLRAAEEGDTPLQDIDDEEERPPSRPTGSAALSLWEHLRVFYERLTPPEGGSVADRAHWVEELIAGKSGVQLANCVAAQKDTAERDKAALESLAMALGALVLGEAVVGRPSRQGYEAFYAELRSVVDAAVYRVDDFVDRTPVKWGYQPKRPPQVYAASLSGARGVCYRAVAILGLSEGLLPAQVREDPLLSDEDRDDLSRRGLMLEPRLRSDQQTLFYEAVTRGKEYLFLSRPYLADDGELWEESPYWTATRSLFDAHVRRVRLEDIRPHYESASHAELFAWSVRRRSLPGLYSGLMAEWNTLRQLGAMIRSRLDAKASGDYEGDASALRPRLAARYGPDHVWSTSRLETYSACPFLFYTAVALGLEERQPPERGYDAAKLGSILHEVLEAVYRQTGDRLSLDELLTTLSDVAVPIFENAPRKYGFRPTSLWEAQKQELIGSLSKTLAGLVEQGKRFRPTHFELQFGIGDEPPLAIETNEGKMLFRGIIDRVDLDQEGNIRIIDYKTGSSGLGTKDMIDGHRLQLAVYSLAAERCLRLGSPIDGFYWSILSGKASQLRLQSFEHRDEDGRAYRGASGAIDLMVKHVERFVRGLRAGVFTSAPPASGCKDYCAARLFCWRYRPSLW